MRNRSFNSILVRLKGIIRGSSSKLKTSFQFHSGTIKRIPKHSTNHGKSKFQFHSGTIKSDEETLRAIWTFGFNSILVRLKGGHRGGLQNRDRFQFHSGTIKSAFAAAPCTVCSLFQFHSGTIKRKRYGGMDQRLNCFNSILVRLKVFNVGKAYMDIPLFQFHSGTIKS